MTDWAATVAGRGRIVLAVVGVALLALALILLVSVETRMLRVQTSLADAIHDLGSPAEVDRADVYGQLVRISGTPQILTPPADPQFGVSADAPVLTRKVAMLQWQEFQYGGGPPGYQRDWVTYDIDSSKFTQPGGHANPEPMPFHGKRFQAADVRIGGLQMSRGLVYSIPGQEAFSPQLSNMPANLAATFALRDGMLWSNPVAGSPRLGDLRVSWTIVPKTVLTIVARVRGNELVAADDLPGGFSVFLGDVPLDVLMPGLPHPPTMVWLWRVLALVLVAAGCVLLIRTASPGQRDPLLPAALSIAVVALAEALCWWSAHLVLALLALALSIVAIAAAYWRWRMARPNH